VQAAINEPATLMNLAAIRVSDLGSAASTLENQVKTIQLDFSMVLQSYRNANLAVRVTPPPEYFKEMPDLTGNAKEVNPDHLIIRLNSLKDGLDKHRETYQESLNTKLRLLEAESANVLTDLVPRFFKSVDEEAHLKITKSANP
jgi:hypothetical protein